MPSILITGSNRGLGFEFAKQYLADGWQVYAACRDPGSASELRQLADESGHKLHILALDVTNPASVKAHLTRVVWRQLKMADKQHDTTRMSRYYNGPVSDHFDGVRFFDPAAGLREADVIYCVGSSIVTGVPPEAVAEAVQESQQTLCSDLEAWSSSQP